MNWGVIIPLGDEEFPSILSKILVIFLLSFNWPIYMSFITGICIIGFEGASISNVLFQPVFWHLYITAAITFTLTLILWKNDTIWKIRWF